MKQLVIWVAFATFFIKINAEKFSCEGRASGYYADVDTGCQVYHMCDGLGRQFSYSCPNTTLFQQRMLICDHWYMVNCSKAEVDYKANLLIGQKDKPFVEDSSEHPYHRTPRPDILEQPYAPRNQDEEYRQGRAQSLPSSLNLVGVVTDDDAEDELGNRKNFTTDRPQYFLPSHWSTQYGKYVTTPIPPKSSKPNNQFIAKAPAAPEKKFPNPDFKDFKDVKNRDVPPRKQPPQNFNNQKFFKVPPKVIQAPQSDSIFINSRIDNIPDSINQESVSPSTLALPPFVPPSPNNQPQVVPQNPRLNNQPQVVPQNPRPNNQPKVVPQTSRQPQSQQPVLITKPPQNQKPSSFAPPPLVQSIDMSNFPKPSIYYQPPKLGTPLLVESSTMDPETFYKLIPSKDLVPPPLLPQLPVIPNAPQSPLRVITNTEKTKEQKSQNQQQQQQLPQAQPQTQSQQQSQQQNKEVASQQSDNSENRWKELRQMFFIPEYDFPLETGSRPSYESGLSSFQVNVAPPIPETFRRPSVEQSGPRGINPECPKCDPAFLAPGTCKPCVMIR